MTPEELSRFVLALRAGAQNGSDRALTAEALSLLAKRLPFDLAWWGLCCAAPHGWHVAAEHVHAQAGWTRPLPPLHRPAASSRSPEVSRTPPAPAASRMGAGSRMIASADAGVDQLRETLALYRVGPGRGFSATERRLLDTMMPHLAAARCAARWRELNTLRARLAPGASGPCGLVSSNGLLLAGDPDLRATLRRRWPQWSGPQLPEPVQALVDGSTEWLDDGRAVRLARAGDECLLVIAPPGPTATVTRPSPDRSITWH